MFIENAISQVETNLNDFDNKRYYSEVICSKIKNMDCYNMNSKYFIKYIFTLEKSDTAKPIFYENGTIYNTSFIFNSIFGDYPVNETIIYDSLQEVVAYSGNNEVYCNLQYKTTKGLLDFIIRNNIGFVFRISGYNGSRYFCIWNEKIMEFYIGNEEITFKPYLP
jgi:hypothetical protein